MLWKKQIRLKLSVGLSIVAVAALTVVSGLPTKPRVEVSFIRYAQDGPAVLKLTSRAPVPVRCSSPNVWLFLDVPPRAFQQTITVMPRSQTQLLVTPYSSQEPRRPGSPT